MNEENVFGKLRRIARNVQNESALAEKRMCRPSALRASGDSARPVLQRMRRDAHNVKRESEDRLSHQPSPSEFCNTLDSCSALCSAYRTKLNEIESYLQQYGYQPMQSNNMKNIPSVKNSAVRAESKAPSKAPDPGEVKTTGTEAQEDEESKENIPATPPRNTELSSSMKGGTPRLEDYGLSRGFLDMMSRNKLRGQEEIVRPTSVNEGAVMNSTYSRKDTVDAFTPLRTSSQASACPFTPLGCTATPAGVTVTPGMFGGNALPTETPTQFIEMVTGRPLGDARHGPEHGGGGMSHPKKSLHFGSSYHNTAASSVLDAIPSHLTSEIDGNFGTPPAPEMTARWNFTALPPPPPEQPDLKFTPNQEPRVELAPPISTHTGYQHMALDTPPEPEMTMKWDTRSLSAMPVAPERLTANIHHEPLEEPVRLTSALHRQTPEEPQLLLKKNAAISKHTPEEPQLMLHSYGAPPSGETPETPPGLTGRLGRAKTFDLSKFLSEDMPKTPELTMSYARFVDPASSSATSKMELPPNQPHNPSQSKTLEHSSASIPKAPVNVSFSCISEVDVSEFESQSDHMRRILPLEFVNETIRKMNIILQGKANKGSPVCLADADLQDLELGVKSKAMLLLLIKLQRLTNSKTAGSADHSYYPVA